MNKKRLGFLILIIIIILVSFISACSNEIKINSKHKNVRDTLEFLTSNDCDGRLTGTNGNLLTQEFLVNSLDSFGLEKLNGTFKDEFQYNHLIMGDIIFEAGQKKFAFSKDFSVLKISNSDLLYPLSTNNSLSVDCIVLLESLDNIDILLNDDRVKGILVKNDSHFKPFFPDERKIFDKPVFYVSKDTYGYLYKNSGTNVRIKSSFTMRKKTDNNIIGIIKANNAKKAIVLSAHFDHLGSINGQIFRGAVDNASGAAALLEIAKNLSQSIKKETLNTDIIFVFFNAEEIGKLGSKSFAERIQSRYGHENVMNINIDCIGDIDCSTLNIYFSNSSMQNITEKLIHQLNKESITDINDPNNNETSGSDNIWFSNNINIYIDSPYIHELDDTIKILDSMYINNISKSITNLILDFPESEVQNQEKSKRDKIILEESIKLNNFEYKFLEVEGNTEYIGNNYISGTFDEVNKYFNNKLDIIPIKLIDKAKISSFVISLQYSNKIDYASQQLNTIYKRNYNYQDISFFSILATKKVAQNNGIDALQNRQITVIKIAYTDKDLQNHVYNFYTKEFGLDTFKYNGYQLHYKYTEEKGGEINCISKNPTEQCVYIYNITDDTIDSFDKEKIITLIEDNDIFSTLKGIEMLLNTSGTISFENFE